ncbi:hypothetical protein CRUP_024229 [Coryphaenoides rupestris]|nr:hypothetical protein CRUP_024229 [Coryphaenoides rupestris]
MSCRSNRLSPFTTGEQKRFRRGPSDTSRGPEPPTHHRRRHGRQQIGNSAKPGKRIAKTHKAQGRGSTLLDKGPYVQLIQSSPRSLSGDGANGD